MVLLDDLEYGAPGLWQRGLILVPKRLFVGYCCFVQLLPLGRVALLETLVDGATIAGTRKLESILRRPRPLQSFLVNDAFLRLCLLSRRC